MKQKCSRCGRDIPWPYFHCDVCLLALLREGMAERARETVVRSAAAASVLPLTMDDRAFLREMAVGCD